MVQSTDPRVWTCNRSNCSTTIYKQFSFTYYIELTLICVLFFFRAGFLQDNIKGSSFGFGGGKIDSSAKRLLS
jgi:hypothetical protein